MSPTNSVQISREQTITPGASISGIGSALLVILFFAPWFTACNVDVSGLNLATQQNAQGQSAWWLLGIPLVGLVGAIIVITSLKKPSTVVRQRARITLAIAFYPLLCIAILYFDLKNQQQSLLLDLRQLIEFKYGFWGTILAALAMSVGAAMDIAMLKGMSLKGLSPPPIPGVKSKALRGKTAPHRSPPIGQPRAWLQGLNDESAHRQWEIAGDTLTIGRHQTNDLCLNSKAVSRRHAVIRYGQGRYFIQDQGSAVGTYVNGQPVNARELKPGDIVRVGQTEIQFHVS